MQMIDVNEQILLFRKFLLDSWEDLGFLMANHDWEGDSNFIDDWLQVNWEFLVERQLLKNLGYLNHFDMLFKRERVTNKNKKITHLICCGPKEGHVLIDDQSGKPLPTNCLLIFHCFYKKMGRSHGLYPPFDSVGIVLGDPKKRFYVSLETVNFFLFSLSENDPGNSGAWYLN